MDAKSTVGVRVKLTISEPWKVQGVGVGNGRSRSWWGLAPSSHINTGGTLKRKYNT